MTVALCVLAAMNIALLVILDRQGRRHSHERDAHRTDVAGLCQRLQAPGVAVAQYATQGAEQTDDSFPLTDEQITELEERHAAITRIEALENGDVGALR